MSTVLTYRHLGDSIQVGQPLGCDPTGWPYRVEAVEHDGHLTRVTVEPWPIPGARASEDEKQSQTAAMSHAVERMVGVIR